MLARLLLARRLRVDGGHLQQDLEQLSAARLERTGTDRPLLNTTR